MKDNFSVQSAQYAKFRPSYPDELYSYLLTIVEHTHAAWDCGTGNGQVAHKLAKYFDVVYATDISQQQLDNAIQRPNIIYSKAPAEHSAFPDNSFDLITVAQAIHWFDFDGFYKEINRTIKHNGILAVIGYGLLKTDDNLDPVIEHFYDHIIGPYWDKERRYIDENYQSIPFPFKEIEPIHLTLQYEWNFEQLIGFFNTWSAVQHYINDKGKDPVDNIHDQLKECWGKEDVKTIRFPLLLRIGRVEK